jgi:PAS domain S-box-containing protein
MAKPRKRFEIEEPEPAAPPRESDPEDRIRVLEELLEAYELAATEQSDRVQVVLEQLHRRNVELQESRGRLASQTRVLQSILDSLSDGVVVADPRGNFTLFNPAAERITGFGMTAAPPEEWSDYYGVYKQDSVTPFPVAELPMVRAIHGEATDDVLQFIRNERVPDGVFVSVSGRPIHDDQGELIGGVIVFRDISQRVRAEAELRSARADLERRVEARTHELTQANLALQEEVRERSRAARALRESEERFRSLIESIRDYAIYMLDAAGRIGTWNLGAQRIHGFQSEEILGRPVADLYPEEDRAEVEESLQQARKTGSIHTERWQLRRDGTRFWAETVLTALRDEDGGLVGFARLTRDLTERRLAEEAVRRSETRYRRLSEQLEQRVEERTHQLEAANRELTGLNRELEAFSYSVSHDLRAPLRSIDGFSRALLEDYGEALEPQAVDYLDRVRRAAQRIGSLIDDLLLLSRVTRADLREETINLSGMAREILDELKAADPGRNVEWEIAEGLTALGDRHLIRLALENLLGNAWKFTSRRPVARIEVGATERDGESFFFIRDNGAGFDPERVDRLFRPFSRLHDSEEFEGTGIGLATVQRILHRHGGRIVAEGQPEKGATFYFNV